MSLTNCPSDVLSIITTFLYNKSSIGLIQTCSSINRHGKEFGYLIRISIDSTSDMMEFIRRFCDHSKHLKYVYVRGINNPHIWLPHYVERLVFDHCSINSYINPGKQAYTTKSLVIRDYHRYKNKQTLRINWNCFPNLEELELYVYDVDWKNSFIMRKLKRVNIDTVYKR